VVTHEETIAAAHAAQDRLNRISRALHDVEHPLNNALRNARVAQVGSGILHRTPPPYADAVAEVAARLEDAEKVLALFPLDAAAG